MTLNSFCKGLTSPAGYVQLATFFQAFMTPGSVLWVIPGYGLPPDGVMVEFLLACGISIFLLRGNARHMEQRGYDRSSVQLSMSKCLYLIAFSLFLCWIGYALASIVGQKVGL